MADLAVDIFLSLAPFWLVFMVSWGIMHVVIAAVRSRPLSQMPLLPPILSSLIPLTLTAWLLPDGRGGLGDLLFRGSLVWAGAVWLVIALVALYRLTAGVDEGCSGG